MLAIVMSIYSFFMPMLMPVFTVSGQMASTRIFWAVYSTATVLMGMSIALFDAQYAASASASASESTAC